MKTIWKWKITPGFNKFAMPAEAEVLTVQMQDGWPVLWAVVDPEQPIEMRTFYVHPTGRTLTDVPGEYVGTFQLNDYVVVHLFEE